MECGFAIVHSVVGLLSTGSLLPLRSRRVLLALIEGGEGLGMRGQADGTANYRGNMNRRLQRDQHAIRFARHQTDEGRQHDQRREQSLAEQGYQAVRIPGYEVLRNAAAVRRQIEGAIDERIEQRTPSSPALLPRDKSEHHSPSSRGRREPE